MSSPCLVSWSEGSFSLTPSRAALEPLLAAGPLGVTSVDQFNLVAVQPVWFCPFVGVFSNV